MERGRERSMFSWQLVKKSSSIGESVRFGGTDDDECDKEEGKAERGVRQILHKIPRRSGRSHSLRSSLRVSAQKPSFRVVMTAARNSAPSRLYVKK